MIDKYRNKIMIGHVLEQLAKLPDNSVDMCITSPPYWGLRDYDTEHQVWDEHKECWHDGNDYMCHPGVEHEWEEDGKQATKLGAGGITHEINAKVRRPKSSATYHCNECSAWLGSLGLEPTPNMFVQHLVQIFQEVRRVLKPEGTLWINLGDTYASSGGLTQEKHREKAKVGNTKSGVQSSPRYNQQSFGKVEQKSLIGIPDRLKIALIDAGMLCRNEIIWYKPNAMPQSAKDRFTNDTEKLYLFAMQKRYYFEQQFEPFLEDSLDDLLRRKTMTYYKDEGSESKYVTNETGLDGDKTGRTRDEFYGDLNKGRNKRTTWKDESKYEDTEEEASYRQGMHKDRGKGQIQKRPLDKFPTQKEFVDWMREHAPLKKVIGWVDIKKSTLEHWYRYDDSGFSFPTVEDWEIMQDDYFQHETTFHMSNEEHPEDPFPVLAQCWYVSDAIKPYAVQERTKDYVEYRELPPHDELREYLQAARKRVGITIEEVEKIFGTQAPHHWFERNGSYPSLTDYIKISEILDLDDTYNEAMCTIYIKPSEKTSSIYGRNKRTTWIDGENVKPAVTMEIPTRAMAEAHFAVFPEALVETPIEAGCPIGICEECNKPKLIEYETDKINTRPGKDTLKGKSGTDENPNLSLHSSDLSKFRQQIVRSNFRYVAQCKCGVGFKPGIVMDIFLGSGTTALVAKQLERDYIGIELNKEYAKVASKRIRTGKTKANIPEGYAQMDVTKGL